MIRLTYLLRRRPELSAAEFHRYWLEQHGPLVAGHARRINALRYVQVHAVDDPANEAMAEARGGMEPPYDGAAELWFESEQALAAAFTTDAGRTAAAELLEDEATFIDLPASPLWLNHEMPQVNPPEPVVAGERTTLVKLYYPLRQREGLSTPAAQRYWFASHGPLIRRQAAGSGIRRYLQVHRIDSDLEQSLREARGTRVAPYLGHAELWFDRAGLQVSTVERREANRRAIEDESGFIDFSRSTMWLAKEHVLVDHW